MSSSEAAAYLPDDDCGEGKLGDETAISVTLPHHDFGRLLSATSNLQAQLHDSKAYPILVAAIAPAHTHQTPCRSQANTPQRPSLSPRARRSARPSDPLCRPKPSTQTTRYLHPPTTTHALADRTSLTRPLPLSKAHRLRPPLQARTRLRPPLRLRRRRPLRRLRPRRHALVGAHLPLRSR